MRVALRRVDRVDLAPDLGSDAVGDRQRGLEPGGVARLHEAPAAGEAATQAAERVTGELVAAVRSDPGRRSIGRSEARIEQQEMVLGLEADESASR